ncbi:MAG: UDP-N-acetyl glucosamine 2-epimerase [Herbinix sp.]|jgi:GDP/UDP-N,N'-diacetylbacillosamine 2-epimerase (hydrolysing)|nr:UDP-N-acetyl glucosamine 2-epimerase [Herbinix sp.]
MKRVCIVTATRAEYGLLKNLISSLINLSKYEVKIVATGMHLSPEFGQTYKEIEEDGFQIDEKIEILLSADTSSAISKSMGIALIGFADYFERKKPDLLILLGDRYETLAVCCAALNSRIPIAHIHGGETTEGAIDEAIRHAVSKMSYLHFTTTQEYRNRVIQLGETPDRVFTVGALGVENIYKTQLLDKSEVEQILGITTDTPYTLLTFHPVTLEYGTALSQFTEIILALDKVDNIKVVITKANADADGRVINKMIDDLSTKDPNKYKAFTSLGALKYLSAMKYCSFVIGNTSSGIIEAPSFKIPTINIGDRQRGRAQAASVINCKPISTEISDAIQKVFSAEFQKQLQQIENPYGDGTASEKITHVIDNYLDNNKLDIKKVFYNINMKME